MSAARVSACRGWELFAWLFRRTPIAFIAGLYAREHRKAGWAQSRIAHRSRWMISPGLRQRAASPCREYLATTSISSSYRDVVAGLLLGVFHEPGRN